MAAVERLETVAPDLAGRFRGADDEYFDLQEAHEAGSASEHDFLEAFARARAVSAVWQALDPDPLTAALEATYEAYSAFGDGDGALEAAERALGIP